MKSSVSPLLKRLAAALPRNVLSTDPEVLKKYSGDKWFASHLPEGVARPGTVAGVSQVLAFAHKHRIPVTARGAGHGYVGGCVPQHGGLVLSVERLNRIREINPADFVAVVQAGVRTQTLQDAVEKQGLYYPPDPASRQDCSIGGNINTNAGGPRCLKYGVTRDYVLGLQVVRADGTVLNVGGRTHKNKTGFDLARFFVASEGLLGVITEATLKLLPLPADRALLAIGFSSMTEAAQALRAVFAGGFLPCALEIADEFTLAAARKRTGSQRLNGCNAMLFVELDGSRQALAADLAELVRLIRDLKPLFLEPAMGADACEKLWQLRREFSYALRDTGLTKLNEDIVVPRGRLEELFQFTAGLQKKSGLAVACFGHAGDGNIHVNIMVDYQQAGARERSEAALDELFKRVIAWKGAITGEHGIGLAKKRWWSQATTPEVRQMHRDIKRALDPHGILNPGKFLD